MQYIFTVSTLKEIEFQTLASFEYALWCPMDLFVIHSCTNHGQCIHSYLHRVALLVIIELPSRLEVLELVAALQPPLLQKVLEPLLRPVIRKVCCYASLNF